MTVEDMEPYSPTASDALLSDDSQRTTPELEQGPSLEHVADLEFPSLADKTRNLHYPHRSRRLSDTPPWAAKLSAAASWRVGRNFISRRAMLVLLSFTLISYCVSNIVNTITKLADRRQIGFAYVNGLVGYPGRLKDVAVQGLELLRWDSAADAYEPLRPDLVRRMSLDVAGTGRILGC